VPISIVYMGTPDFAVPPLRALHQAGYNVPLVVTQPDRPKGRGRALAPPPVKTAALELGCDILQPETVRDPVIIEQIKAQAPDFLVVVAFGQILPAAILKIPAQGPINVHASLLPRYRGPAPIQWAILRGETETGITTILMDSGVDTGDMLISARTAIRSDETADMLHDRLAHLGAEVLLETLSQLTNGRLFPQAQKHDLATYAPMLQKQDGHIDWQQEIARLDRFVRAMTSWPGAFCFWDDKRLRILKACPILGQPKPVAPGTVVERFPDELCVAAKDGLLLIEEIQNQSGKRMTAKVFLRGNRLLPGTVLR
jgi:methionyl-tRNA formyltransferase